MNAAAELETIGNRLEIFYCLRLLYPDSPTIHELKTNKNCLQIRPNGYLDLQIVMFNVFIRLDLQIVMFNVFIRFLGTIKPLSLASVTFIVDLISFFRWNKTPFHS